MPVDKYRCYTVFLGQDPNYEDFRLIRVMGMKWDLCEMVGQMLTMNLFT